MQHYLKDFSITGILEDKEGNLWVTSTENGIFFCKNNSVVNNTFFAKDKMTFSKIIDNKLIIAVPRKLGFFDLSNSFHQVYNNKINNASQVSDVTPTKGSYIFSTTANTIKTSVNLEFQKEILYANGLSIPSKGILKNSLGKYFLYTQTSIYKLNHDTAKIILALNDTKIKNAISTVNGLMILTNKGLYVINNSKLQEYIDNRKQITSSALATNIIDSSFTNKLNNILYQDSSFNYWLLPFNDSITVLDSKFHLKSLIVLNTKNLVCREILEVNKTTFLISSNKGIIYFHYNDKTYKTYSLKIFDETHGINSSDIYKVLLFNNKFYVSTTKGICIFDKIEDLYHQSAPNTIISSVKVNDSCINAKIDTEFIYKRNNLSFAIDALTYKKINQKGTFFKYKLVGFDSDFKIADGNEITYNNLPPGTYTFIAKAFYDDETEDTTPATFTFTVKPPFWQTWWGILLMLLLGISIVLLILEWRIKKIKKIEQEKAAINQTIAEYKFTALKAQMNPHFVFNSINVIQNLILEKDKQEAYNSLTTFSKLIRKILNQSDSVYSTVEDELELTKAFINLNKLRVDYPFEFFETVSADAMQCYIPSLIIQPFIENSLWHGILPLKGSKVGIIKLNISLKEGNILNIIIQDNGIGRKAASENKTLSTKHVSKGLTLIKERLEAYRVLNNNCIANLTITDIEEGSFTGTFVELNLELPHDE